MAMRTFLLIVGIALILIGLLAALQALGLIDRIHPATTDDAIFCAVLYAAGFGAFYLRHRITEPDEKK